MKRVHGKAAALVHSPPNKKSRTLPLLEPVAKPSLSGSAGLSAGTANVKVAVRIRPANRKEAEALEAVDLPGGGAKRHTNTRITVRPVDEQMLLFDPKDDDEPFFYMGVKQVSYNHIKKVNKDMQFVFDRVFGEDTTNRQVFEECTEQLVSHLLDGYNCSVFAYGATGAGKTHTMLGAPDNPGVVYLTVDELFRRMTEQSAEKNFDVCVSYLEIYNETVRDLLRPSDPLNLRDDGKYGVVVVGLYSRTISTARELVDMLEKGNRNRTQHPTDANAESSRSHAVFQVYVKMRTKTTSQVKIVKLSMIDLAGSERAAATGCKGERFKEGANINRSLLALGNCINQLADGAKFIPYRDSKLTRLLKDSLGGNCCTVMIANVAPTSMSYEDTYNTLKYATRASKIQLKIKKNIVNCDNHISHYVSQNAELASRIKQLEEELKRAKENAVSPPAPTPVAVDLVEEWQSKHRSDLERHWTIVSNLLKKQTQQRKLAARILRKRRAALTISKLSLEHNEDFRKEINKLESSSDALLQQAKQLKTDIEGMKIEYETSKKKIDQLIERDIGDRPGLQSIRKRINNEKTAISSEIIIKHLGDLARMQHSEVKDLHKFVEDSLKLLKKCFFTLKVHGKSTPLITEEYNHLIRLAKNSRAVTWEDSPNDDETDTAYLQYLSNIDDTSFDSITEIPNLDSLIADPEEEITSTSLAFPVPNFPDETMLLLNEENDLNSTHVISSSFPDTMDPADSTRKNDKPINPSDLNSTFVLAQKPDYDAIKNKFKLDVKKILLETTNLPPKDDKYTFKNPIGKTFKKPIVPNIENKGFGSSSNRFQYPVKNENVQVGYKTMRKKERNALTSANTPYGKPLLRR